MPTKRDLKSIVGGASEGIRRGAGLGGMIGSSPVENTEATESTELTIEREVVSTRLPKGFRKRMMLLAVAQEREVQELYEEAVRAYLEVNEPASNSKST